MECSSLVLFFSIRSCNVARDLNTLGVLVIFIVVVSMRFERKLFSVSA